MPTSPARIAANQANSLKSTGPRTEGGKARSKANALKHGLTGEGVVLPDEDVAEVDRLTRAYSSELKAEGETGHALARRMAVMSVRMERSYEQETAALTERVCRVLDEFEAPEGTDPALAAQLREEARCIALFDPSKEATLARKYEAAAERCFFRAMKELRQRAKESAKASGLEMASRARAEAQASIQRLASFSPAVVKPTPAPARPAPVAPKSVDPAPLPWDFAPSGAFEVPFTIGRAG